MTDDEYQRALTELATEAATLRERLHYFENLVHDRLACNVEEHNSRINNAERQIRKIVLRLAEVDRERTELNIARAV